MAERTEPPVSRRSQLIDIGIVNVKSSRAVTGLTGELFVVSDVNGVDDFIVAIYADVVACVCDFLGCNFDDCRSSIVAVKTEISGHHLGFQQNQASDNSDGQKRQAFQLFRYLLPERAEFIAVTACIHGN